MGLMVGVGTGYYFGAKAGRERYEQLNRWMDRARDTAAYDRTAVAARDLARNSVGAAKARISSEDDETELDLQSPLNGSDTTA